MILALTLYLQDAADYYKFPPNTTWDYVGKAQGEKATAHFRVSRHLKDRVHVEVTELRDSWRAARNYAFVWYVDGDTVRMDKMADGKTQPFYSLLRIGSKKGDSWTAPGFNEGILDVTHMGIESVTVPAGTFPEALHVRMLLTPKAGGEKTTYDFHIAPGTGILRMQTNDEIFELKEWKKG